MRRTAEGALGRRRRGALLLVCGLAAGGCSTPVPRSAPPPSAPPVVQADQGRVKQVFIFQGRVATELLERYQFASPDMAPEPMLADAESRMNERCSYLNQAAVAYLEGGKPNWSLKMKVYASVDACEAAAHDLADLLRQDSQSIAVSEVAR